MPAKDPLKPIQFLLSSPTVPRAARSSQSLEQERYRRWDPCPMISKVGAIGRRPERIKCIVETRNEVIHASLFMANSRRIQAKIQPCG